MKILLSAAATAMALTALAGCSGDDDGNTATDPAEKSDTTTEPTPTRRTAATGSYPEFDAADYTFVLEQLCYCPVDRTGQGHGRGRRGHVRRDHQGRARDEEGQRRPGVPLDHDQRRDRPRQRHRVPPQVDVDWPDGQDWPSTVAIDQIENAVDDEVTYTIRDVSVG